MKKSTLLIESEISDVLLAVGLSANLQGFHFLKDAIIDVLKTPKLLHQLTKRLYPEVANKYGVTSAIVERSMRHAIDAGCKSGAIYNINDMLNATYFTVEERPCNGCFIGLVVEIVKRNMYKYVAALDSKTGPDNEQLAKDIQEEIGDYKDSLTA